MSVINYADIIIAFMAVIAGIVSYFEYRSYKQKENNKLLSELNMRYTNNEDIQLVVRYLREIDPDNTKPTPYQTELFLRFFEELGVYLEHNSLNKKDVNTFFSYYLNRMYECERGEELRKEAGVKDTAEAGDDWFHLNQYRKHVKNIGDKKAYTLKSLLDTWLKKVTVLKHT